MPAAFTGGPYFVSEFVPSSPSNLVEFLADCVNSSGWKLVESVPAYGTTVTLNSIIYTFKNSPTLPHHIQIGSNAQDTAANFVTVIDTTSTTIVATFDGLNILTLQYIAGGTSGNGTIVTGWIAWSGGGGNSTNTLYGGGYKFRTSFPEAVPSIVYIADTYVTSFVNQRKAAVVQFMSGDESIQGTIHQLHANSQQYRFIGSPVQFFLYNKESLSDNNGAFVCGGSYYTPQDPQPADAWYSFGDWYNYIFGASDSPRQSLGIGTPQASECCFDGSYCGPGAGPGSTNVTLYSTQDDQFQTGSTPQPMKRYGGDAWVSEPFLVSGDTNGTTPLRLRGQLYDALIVCKAYSTGASGTDLAAEFPWSDGSTRGDGLPRNRLSADFDNVRQWENITEDYVYGALFVASTDFVTTRKANFAY